MWLPIQIKERLYYIDALRGFLMVFGVVLHASALQNGPLQQFIGYSSGIFRMAAFFVIAGFFTSFVFSRMKAEDALKKRLLSVAVPFLLLVTLANPVANYVLYNIYVGDISFYSYITGWRFLEDHDAPIPIAWLLHLWFLLVLAIYTVSYIPLQKIVASSLVASALKKILSPQDYPQYSFFLLALGFAGVAIAARGAYFILLQPTLGETPINFLCITTLYYFPFYVLGVVLFHYHILFTLMHRFFWQQFLLGVVVVYGIEATYDPLVQMIGTPVTELFLRTAKAFLAICTTNLLLFLCSKYIKNKSTFSLMLADSAYTVYLLHLYVLIGIAAVLTHFGFNTEPFYAAGIIACSIFCFGVHYFIVSKYTVVAKLLNGKFDTKKPRKIMQETFPIEPQTSCQPL